MKSTDDIVNSELFKEKYNDLVDKSSYYKTTMHKAHCKICKGDKELRDKLNQKLLNGESARTLTYYLLEMYPDIFNDERNTMRCLNAHREYLPMLLDDVLVKSVFQRARSIIENKDLNDMADIEKAQLIAQIEDQLVKEYSDMESHRISILNVLFKETLPLFLTRLHTEIVTGKARDVKDLTDASNTIMKITTMLSIKEDSNEKEDDTSSFLEMEAQTGNTKNKVLSLADKLKETTERVL